jgi:hypothetical protein
MTTASSMLVSISTRKIISFFLQVRFSIGSSNAGPVPSFLQSNVGLLEGALNKSCVGIVVGMGDSFNEGCKDGLPVGSIDGLSVGIIVGKNDFDEGLKVGLPVGSTKITLCPVEFLNLETSTAAVLICFTLSWNSSPIGLCS